MSIKRFIYTFIIVTVLFIVSVQISVWIIPLYKLLCGIDNGIGDSEIVVVENVGSIRETFLHFYNQLIIINDEWVLKDLYWIQIYVDWKELLGIELSRLECVELCSDESIITNDSFVIFEVQFITYTSSSTVLEFTNLQASLYSRIEETGLCFFRVYNPTEYKVSIICIYIPYPSELTLYISKVQCFCSDPLQCNVYESVELPILFYLEDSVLEDAIDNELGVIILTYTMFTIMT